MLLDIGLMGMNNNDAHKREGVMPTYKKHVGFGAFQMTWEGFIKITNAKTRAIFDHWSNVSLVFRPPIQWKSGVYKDKFC